MAQIGLQSMFSPKSINMDAVAARSYQQRACIPEKFLLHGGGVNSSVFSLPRLQSHDWVKHIYRGCSTFIFAHHKKIVLCMQYSQNLQLQETPGSETHRVGFYPYFQTDCEQFEQLAQYRNRATYAGFSARH